MLLESYITPSWFGVRAEGLSDILDHVANEKAVWPSDQLQSQTKGDSDFFGTFTYGDAVNLARYGWPEGLEKMKSGMATAAMLQPSAPIQQTAYDVAGAFPDVGLYCAGDPACMVSFDPEQAKAKPIYRFVVNVSYTANVDFRTVQNRGIAILSYADKLEREGARVEIIALRSTTKHGKTFSFTFPVKRSDEALELDRLAFVLAHPAMLRRIGFALAERYRVLNQWFGEHGYKSCDAMPSEWQAPRSVYFECLNSADYNSTYSTIAKAMAIVEGIIGRAIKTMG